MEKPAEYVSIKFLLKQVYAAYTAAVKDLEVEVANLKQQLKEAQQSAVSPEQECTKCKQLESAFIVCKEEYRKLMLEHTRRFQDLDHMFPEVDKSKREELKSCEAKDLQELCEDTINETLLESPVIDNNQEHLLKHLPNPDAQFGTLIDTSVVNLPSRTDVPLLLRDLDESLRENENFVLVPDTAEILPETKHVTSSKKLRKLKKVSNSIEENHDKENSPRSPRIFASKKRSLSELKLNEFEISHKRSNSVQSLSISLSKSGTTHLNRNAPITSADKSLSGQAQIVTRIKSATDANIPWSETFRDFADLPKTLRPSTQQKNEIKILDDIDEDFQYNASEQSNSWKTSIKKKEVKKVQLLKAVKSASKYKLTLEAPKPGDKKNYKQTKLSNSLFISKKVTESVDSSKLNDRISDNGEKSSMVDASHLAALAEEADTCPSLNNEIPSQTATGGSETFCSFELITHCRSVVKSTQNSSIHKQAEVVLIDNEIEVHNVDSNDNMDDNIQEEDSFDRIPVSEEPEYKYKEEAVRNKLKRQQLNAFDCKECQKYYSELGLSSEEMKNRMKGCSRHRAKYAPPATPDHFWEIDFPNTEECKARGYVAETQKVKLKSRRRRPLNSE